MAQFDVYRNPFGDPVKRPFLIELQCSLLDELGLAIVAPLKPGESFPAARRLNPVLKVEGALLALVPTEIVSVRRATLGLPVMSLAGERNAILGALDFMFTGV